jgi:hypothetical protein
MIRLSGAIVNRAGYFDPFFAADADRKFIRVIRATAANKDRSRFLAHVEFTIVDQYWTMLHTRKTLTPRWFRIILDAIQEAKLWQRIKFR